MAMRWGIKYRVLFLALTPTITISLLLGVYFTSIRLADLSKALNDRGTAIASRLASQGEYGLFARDTEALRNLAREAISKEVSSIAFYDKKGNEIASAGKLESEITPPTENLGNIHIITNTHNDTLSFIAPVTLPDVIIDSYTKISMVSGDENLYATIIGWMKVDLDRKATRLKEYQVLIHSALITLLGISISSLLALRLGHDVTQPILSLSDAVAKLKNGNLNTRVDIQSHWELGILESGINTMASSLQVAHEEMQQHIDQATADLRETLKTIEVKNQELQEARKEAEDANEVKSEFLASMSHELRTPLNAITGFLNLLEKTQLSQSQQDYLSTMQKSSHSLLAIINDILDFSKIEAGKLKLDLIPMDIRECVEDALTLLGPGAHDKGIEIVPFIYSDVPTKIISDSLRIKQVITNLVSNSIKFTKEGSVVVRVMLEEDLENVITICISVTDTGIGLTEAHKRELFNAFNQANPNITRQYGGTGLGLVICKKLVEQMNGTIDLESKPDVGSTFWFTIKAEKVQEDETIEDLSLDGIRVFLYEKHTIARLSLAHLLEQWGMRVTEHDQADDIINIISKAHQEGDPYKMVIVGANLPLSQKDFIKNIIDSVRIPFSCSVGVLVNTTNYAVHNEVLQMGAELCLAKPICHRKLFDALNKIILHQANYLNYNLANTDIPGLNILAVDDNPANLKLVKVFLENIGVNVTVANSGVESIELCKNNHYNLILMDLHMPGVDGVQTAREIRNTKNYNSETPILALSAHVLITEKQAIKDAGINDYLTKPIDENSLRASIYKWTQSGVNSISKVNSTIKDTFKGSIDWPMCVELAGNKIDLAKDMLSMLIDSLPVDKANIKQAYNSKDMKQLREHVHRLHGACCYVGVPRLKSIARDLENAIVMVDHGLIADLTKKASCEIARILAEYERHAVYT